MLLSRIFQMTRKLANIKQQHRVGVGSLAGAGYSARISAQWSP